MHELIDLLIYNSTIDEKHEYKIYELILEMLEWF